MGQETSWNYMRNLHNNANAPWLILGDFNEIVVGSEKKGGIARPSNMMESFRNCIEDCGLQEVYMLGDPFTWSHGLIRERLDRALCNAAWAAKFPAAGFIHENHVHSDHRPILLDTEHFKPTSSKQCRKKRFEVRWLKEDSVNEIVNSAWARAKFSGVGPTLADRTKAVHADRS